jgi:hypothetical protein
MFVGDTGSQAHMMHHRHSERINVAASSNKAVFGNDLFLPIEETADLCNLLDVQLCTGMSKQLLAPQCLAVDSSQYSLCTEVGMYVLKPGAMVDFKRSDLAFFMPLVDGLYQAEESVVLSAMRLAEEKK